MTVLSMTKLLVSQEEGWQVYDKRQETTYVPLMEFRSQIASPSSQTASLHKTALILYAMLQNDLRVYDACKKERRNDPLCVTVGQEPRDGFVVQQDVTPLCRSPDDDAGLGAFQRLQADDGLFLLYHPCCVGAA